MVAVLTQHLSTLLNPCWGEPDMPGGYGMACGRGDVRKRKRKNKKKQEVVCEA